MLGPVARESLARLRHITGENGVPGSASDRAEFVHWIERAIATRNVAGLADPARRNLYPVDFEVLVERHALLGMSREELISRLAALRGLGPEPTFSAPRRRARPAGVTDASRVNARPLQERAPATNLPA